MIWATFSRPYFRVTYSMTSPRRRSQKSMSISGSDTRSGFRKRSKMRSYSQRVDVGDAQAVRHEAAGRRAAARADRDALLARVADEVPDDQEVARVLHPLDHLDLVREARLVLVERMAQRSGRGELPQARQPLGEALAHHVLEVVVERVARAARRSSAGGSRSPLRSTSQRSAMRTVFASASGNSAEDARHLLGGLQVELIAVIAEPLASFTVRPVPMHSSTSCGTWSPCCR